MTGSPFSPHAKGSLRGRQAAVDDALARRAWSRLTAPGVSPGVVLRRLVLLLQRGEPLTRWRAVEGLGAVAEALRPGEVSLLEVVRSLFWSMNDESGNLCWMAPEALGEIFRARPELRKEQAVLLPQYLVEEPFESGALWAMCRLAEGGWKPAEEELEKVIPFFSSVHPKRRGLAVRLVRLLGREALVPPATAEAVFEDYDFDKGTLFYRVVAGRTG